MNGKISALTAKTKIRYGKFFLALFFTYTALFLFPFKIVPKDMPYSYTLYDKTGALLGASVASDGQWRFSLGEVPDKFAQAVIVFEDKRFYYHLGVDPIAVVRAVVSNIRAGRIVSGASTLTMQTMRLLAGNKPRTFGQKCKEETVCADSGYIAGRYCSRTVKGFRPTQAPQGLVCPYCAAVSFTPDGRFQADMSDMTGVYEGRFPLIQNRFVLPPAVEYYYTRFAATYKKLPPFVAGHQGGASSQLAILFPEQGARIVIPIEIDGSAGAMIMQAAARDIGTVIYWDIDGVYLGSTQRTHTMTVRPKIGAHVLTVTDSLGTRRVRTFEVLDAG